MGFTDLQLTTPIFWQVALGVACMDALLILSIWRFLPTNPFARSSRWLMLISFLFFTALWSSVLTWGWDWFYRYIFPPWMHSTGLAWGALYTAIGFGMGWLSRRLPGRPAVTFCWLGGVEGLLTHLWAIYGLGAVSNPPIMHGVDPFAVLIFAVFEKAFYWMLILLLAVGAAHGSDFVRRAISPAKPPMA
jgi:hypothetical protein